MSAPEDDAAKRLRHDVRGLLSPALILADSLAAHESEAVRATAARIAASIEDAVRRLKAG